MLLKFSLWPEAAAIEAALPVATRLVAKGVVLTIFDPAYPRRWLELLGDSAPPALWMQGDVAALSLPSVTVVGSRELSPWHAAFAAAAGAAVCPLDPGKADAPRQEGDLSGRPHAAERGSPMVGARALVSGSAPGADSIAAAATKGPVIEILPAGLDSWPGSRADLRLSLWPASATFTAAAAMERNVLLYAASPVTVLAHARFKTGGSWHGAVTALRRRLTHLLVPDDGELAHRALVALGAQPVPSPDRLMSSLLADHQPLQPCLRSS